jgi:hypothetical protein
MAIPTPMRAGRAGLVLALAGLLSACDGGRGQANGVVAQAVIAGGQQSEAVRQAARDQAADWLARIPTGREGDFGFADRAAMRRVEPGRPWRVVTTDEAALRAAAAGSLPAPRVLDLWRVPLRVDGRARVLLTVVRRGDAYRAVAVGGAGLAADLDGLQRRRGMEQRDRALLRIHRLSSDFALLADGRAYPLASARAYLPLPERPSGEGGLSAAALRRLLLDGFAEVAR